MAFNLTELKSSLRTLVQFLDFRIPHRLNLSARICLGLFSIGSLVVANPALAHHAMGGQLPTNEWEGFLAGVAHPIIGLDHLAFVVAIGLLASQYMHGLFLPAAFVLLAMLGTVIHSLGWNLPATESVIALSVVVLGTLLMLGKRIDLGFLVALFAFAGLFHGYAYGEAIVGAQPTPLLAYLGGFTLIQYCIAVCVLKITRIQAKTAIIEKATKLMRYCGYAICMIGVIFLAKSFGV